MEYLSWITNWRLAEEKSYHQNVQKGHIETDRKDGDVKRPALHLTKMAAEVPKGYLSGGSRGGFFRPLKKHGV